MPRASIFRLGTHRQRAARRSRRRTLNLFIWLGHRRKCQTRKRREREAAVNERWQALDTTAQAVAQTADPQTDAAIRIVAWISHGMLRPTWDDFAMLRLILLALLPQIGGILLMVGRSAK